MTFFNCRIELHAVYHRRVDRLSCVLVSGYQAFREASSRMPDEMSFEANFVVWSVTDNDPTCRLCLQNHQPETRALHHFPDVLHLLPETTRAICFGYERSALSNYQRIRDEFKGTDMEPPSDRFSSREEYD